MLCRPNTLLRSVGRESVILFGSKLVLNALLVQSCGKYVKESMSVRLHVATGPCR